MEKIPTKEQNPNGLHQRYSIKRIVNNPDRDIESSRTILRDIDKDAEYFVFRLDLNGKDINHVKASRIGIHAYANAIEATIPGLAKDLRERYPLI